MNRRMLLSGGSMLALAACSPPGTPIPAQLTNALTVGQTIDQALVKIVNDVANPPISLISPDVQNTVLGDLGLAATGIDAFLSQSLPPSGTPTLGQINAWFSIALNTVAPVLMIALPAATPVVLALEAVDALLPIFEAAIPPAAAPTVAAARATSGRQKIHAAAVASAMTPDEALKVLQTYLAK